MRCLIQAWNNHEAELRRWLISRLGNTTDADDLLQQVFEKAMLQEEGFCHVKNVRAWLFQVARNSLIDSHRLQRDMVELPDDIAVDMPDSEAIEDLSACIPRILSELSLDDREVITRCDIEGMGQQSFATMKGISLSAVKSRIQRARKRIRQHLETGCKVQFDESGKVCCFVSRPRVK